MRTIAVLLGTVFAISGWASSPQTHDTCLYREVPTGTRHSKNVATAPALLKQANYFRDTPLLTEENVVLERSGLELYPDPRAHDADHPAKNLNAWIQDLDAFFADHRKDPAVIALLQDYILHYVNKRTNPLPGDLYAQPRRIKRWHEFFTLPISENGEGHHGEKVAAVDDPLSKHVIRNLRNAMGLKELLESDSFFSARDAKLTFEDRPYEKKDAALELESSLRRRYLNLKLLQEAERLWKKE